MPPSRARRLSATPLHRSHHSHRSQRRRRGAATAAATVAASAAILTALPGAASASVTAGVPTVLHMGPGSETVASGTHLTLGVHLISGNHSVANKTVLFYDRAPGQPWQLWHQVTTNSSGEAFLIYAAQGTLQFTARFRGDDVYAASGSPAYTYTGSSPQRSSASTFGQELLQRTAAQAGKPYEYGAAGPSAFDCSGLIMFVAGQLGVSLPHNAAAQYDDTAHVPQSDLQPGDLVFFDDGGGIYHVGVYAGGGEIWHAPRSGTVVRRDPIWTSSYLVGRLR